MGRLQSHQQILPLLLRQPRLEDCDLIGLGIGHAELGRRAIEEKGGDRIGRPADAVELAPGERLDGTRLLLLGMGFQQLHIGRTQLLRTDSGKNTFHRRSDMGRRRGWRWRELGLRRAGRIGLRHTVIGAVEAIEQRVSRCAG